MSHLVQVKALSKAYTIVQENDLQVLRNIDLTVDEGEVREAEYLPVVLRLAYGLDRLGQIVEKRRVALRSQVVFLVM